MRARDVLLALAVGAATGAGAQSYEWESRDNLMLEPSPPPRIRVEDSRKRLDDLRDNATADDYRTIRIQGKNGRGAYRRVPTEEFAARIERAEQNRDPAEADLRVREPSPY
jgi:hypothetical protein